MMRVLTLFAILWATALTVAAAEESALFAAIRNGDLAYVKAHSTKPQLEVRDRKGATPLMHAAAFGNLETLQVLLEAGADVNARNDFNATALLWCARDAEKARLLIASGADVNAQSKQGRTPLMVASLRPGGSDIVALMLAKGAAVNTKGGRGETALGLAASAGNAETVKLLLARGADPNVPDRSGETAIRKAASGRQDDVVRLLLQKGVDVQNVNIIAGMGKHGPTTRVRVSALHDAAAFGPVETVRDLLKSGAKVNAVDGRGLTPLHFALASEVPSIDIVQTLLQAGADSNARDLTGETPLDWAEKFSYPEVIAALKKAGAKRGVLYEAPKLSAGERADARMALTRSVSLLGNTGSTFFKESGCVGCHHQPMIARAQFRAKAAGVPINESAAKEQLLQMRGEWMPLQEEFLQTLVPPGGTNRLEEVLLGLKASGHVADLITDAAIVNVAESQFPDGHWTAGEVQNRPPMAQSDFAGTARAIRVLQEYGIPARKAEFTERIARGRTWLQKEEPVTTEDVSMRLSGLTWAGATEQELKKAARAVVALQRADGGWAGNPYLQSDAFATGVALTALAESKVVKVSDDAYRRGVAYLLATQYPDGAWHVRSRAIKFQPYFESGFPFGHDQWISVAATSWAVQAIALSLEGRGGSLNAQAGGALSKTR